MSVSSFVTANPEAVAAVADDLAGLGAGMAASNAAAAGSIGAVVPAAADEVSALTAAKFVGHASQYQLMAAAAADIHLLLTRTLAASAMSYAATEAANAVAAG